MFKHLIITVALCASSLPAIADQYAKPFNDQPLVGWELKLVANSRQAAHNG